MPPCSVIYVWHLTQISLTDRRGPCYLHRQPRRCSSTSPASICRTLSGDSRHARLVSSCPRAPVPARPETRSTSALNPTRHTRRGAGTCISAASRDMDRPSSPWPPARQQRGRSTHRWQAAPRRGRRLAPRGCGLRAEASLTATRGGRSSVHPRAAPRRPLAGRLRPNGQKRSGFDGTVMWGSRATSPPWRSPDGGIWVALNVKKASTSSAHFIAAPLPGAARGVAPVPLASSHRPGAAVGPAGLLGALASPQIPHT